MSKLEGRVAVVTGAATGIGRETALELARRGCDVALVTRNNRAGLESTARAVTQLGRRASLHMVDVSDREAMMALPEQVIAEHGHVHVLVNNAGVTLMGDFDQLSWENIDWLFNVNLWGVLHGTKAFLPYLRRESWGHICNVSSMQGLLATTTQTTYAASKFAIRGFSEALRGELSPHGIGVSVVFPGITKTEVVASGRTEGEAAADMQRNLEKILQRYAMDADVCARQLVDCIENNRARALTTPGTRVADLFKRLMPTTTDTVTAFFTRQGVPSS